MAGQTQPDKTQQGPAPSDRMRRVTHVSVCRAQNTRSAFLKPVVVSWCLLLIAAGCGGSPPILGIAVNRAGLTKTPLETTPGHLERVRLHALAREQQADVLGDDRLETLRALSGGVGVEIRSEPGQQAVRIAAPAYLTDFGAVHSSSRAGKKDIVMYVYPVADNVGAFLVVNPENREILARWNETPPPGRFIVGTWRQATALFYTQRDSIVIRTPTGLLVTRLRSPGAGRFRDLYVKHRDGGLVVVASGNGYMPYHLVSVYDSANELVFQETAREHAFALEIDEAPWDFLVTTRTGRWAYAPRRGSARAPPVP